MKEKFPSIFNEVVGPIMRGCSSSHVAAGLRIGLIAYDLTKGNPQKLTVTFDSKEPLAASYDGQGSAMGVTGGFLGLPPDSEDLDQARNIAFEKGIDVQFRIEDVPTNHPNTYLLDIETHGRNIEMEAVSLGGGAIEIWNLMGFNVALAGDLYLTVFYHDSASAFNYQKYLNDEDQQIIQHDYLTEHKKGAGMLLIQSRQPLNAEVFNQLKTAADADFSASIRPVMPVLSGASAELPFQSVKQMLEFATDEMTLADLAYCYEQARSGFTREQLKELMRNVASVMQNSIEKGIQGTEYQDRILPPQAPLAKKMQQHNPLVAGHLQQTIAYVSALMDMKSSMGLIVAAPTGGACGALGGAVWSAVDSLNGGIDEAIDALMAAGIIGVFIAKKATFAGEEGGCQAECGSGSAMSAAALVHLMGGTVKEAVDAASMALQNTLGLVCDTVGDRVEFPCLGRNIMSATNAISCSGMAMAGYNNIIPLDETIVAMNDVSHRIPMELRCTGLAGLATTPTGQAIHKRLLAGEPAL